MDKGMRRGCWMLAGVLAASLPMPAAQARVEPGAAAPLALPETQAIDLDADDASRLTLPVHIAGRGPYPFIIDTGSMKTILSTELARRLALPAGERMDIISMAGRQTLESVAVPRLRFGDEEVSDIAALTIDRAHLGGVGLIGLDSLQDKRVTMDFRRRQLRVVESAERDRDVRDPDVIVVRARRKHGQLILVDSRVGGQAVNVILDTGAQTSVGNMALFRKMKLERLVFPPRPTMLTSVTGAQIEAQYSIVKRISVGSVELVNVPMVFVDAAPFEQLGLHDRPAMLLGMEMLQMFNRIAIDFGRRRVNFEAPRSDRGGETRLAGR